MKHKRQTLSKSGEEDGKDSPGKPTKGEKIQDENSKSCQNCDLVTGGGVGSTPPADHITSRNNNNSSASSGASSVASSIGSSFDKLVAEEDSRSNEMTSPGIPSKKLAEVMIKVEGNKSPPIIKEVTTAVVSLPPVVSQTQHVIAEPPSAPGSLTPSSAPGTPSGLQQQPSPLGIPAPCNTQPVVNPAAVMNYPQVRPRISPSAPCTVATATATASVTAVLQHHMSPVVRGAYPQHAAEYRPRVEYRRSQQCYSPREMFHAQQQRASYCPEPNPYIRQHTNPAPSRVNGIHAPVTTPRTSQQSSRTANYQQYHPAGYPPMYNGYHQEHPAYHCGNNYPNRPQQQQTYQEFQQQQQLQHHETYPQNNNTYNAGYHSGAVYTAENVAQQHAMHHGDSSGYYGDQYAADYKVHQHNYYEPQHGGDASNIPNNYISSPDPFPINSGGTTTPGSGASASVITPPTSIQTDSGDAFGAYHHFYSEPTPADNSSSSSSDFNFLSNLANDFAPEYYQLS